MKNYISPKMNLNKENLKLILFQEICKQLPNLQKLLLEPAINPLRLYASVAHQFFDF